jgi:hypothetical protein
MALRGTALTLTIAVAAAACGPAGPALTPDERRAADAIAAEISVAFAAEPSFALGDQVAKCLAEGRAEAVWRAEATGSSF